MIPTNNLNLRVIVVGIFLFKCNLIKTLNKKLGVIMAAPSLCSRDIADRIGSTVGTAVGAAAAGILAHEGYSALSLNG